MIYRYEVQWWYGSIGRWMSYEYCITKRGSRKTCCNKLANILNTEKWRVVDRKTNRVLYVFSRKTQ